MAHPPMSYMFGTRKANDERNIIRNLVFGDSKSRSQ